MFQLLSALIKAEPKNVHQKSVSFQPAITSSKLTIETLEQGVKYV